MTTITYPLPEDGSAVSIAGDFNGWQPEVMKLSSDERSYEKALESSPEGPRKYKYKFVLANGDWVLKDGTPTTADENGVLNHDIEVNRDLVKTMLDEASGSDDRSELKDHVAPPEHTDIPHDIGKEVVSQGTPNNAYASLEGPTSSSGPGLVDADDVRLGAGEIQNGTNNHHDSHLNPTAPAFNPVAQPFVPASNPPRQTHSHSASRNYHQRQRSQSRSRKSHSRSSSVVSQRPRSGSNMHHEELNPAAHEFKPQFAKPTNNIPHASGYAAALKKPASPPIKDEFKKPHVPPKQSIPAATLRAPATTPPANVANNEHATKSEDSPETVSYAAAVKHANSDLPPTKDRGTKAPAKLSDTTTELHQNGRTPTVSDAAATKDASIERKGRILSDEASQGQIGTPSVDASQNGPSKEHKSVNSQQQSTDREETDTPDVSSSLLRSNGSHEPSPITVATEVLEDNVKSVKDSSSSVLHTMQEALDTAVEGASNKIEASLPSSAVTTEQEAVQNTASAQSSSQAPESLDTVHLSATEYDAEQIRLMEEVCILLDRDDNPIGSASKKDAHLMANIDQGLLHRAFSLFIFNAENKLLLQQRASEKITFPDMWTNTCCSHPLDISGEVAGDLEGSVAGVKCAAQRKVEQELGIPASDAPISDMSFLTRIHYLAPSDGQWGEHEIDYILFLRSDPFLNVNPNEVRDHKWVSQDELREMFASKDLSYTPWFKLICETFLYHWWDNINHLETCKDEQTIHRMGIEPSLFAKIKHDTKASKSVTDVQSAAPETETSSEITTIQSMRESAQDVTLSVQRHSEKLADRVSELKESITSSITSVTTDIANTISSSSGMRSDIDATAEPAAEDIPRDLASNQFPQVNEHTATENIEAADTSSPEHKSILETSEPAAESTTLPVVEEPNPVSSEVQESFNATEAEADSTQPSKEPDAVLELSPAGQAKAAAHAESSAAGDVSRPSTGNSIRATPSFFFYIFNSLFGGIFKGFSSIFDKLAFWRKSPHSSS